MYNSYTLYQATHIKTARQQREEDIRAGELAAEFGRLWHSLRPARPGAAGVPAGAGDRDADRGGRRVLRRVRRAGDNLPLTDARVRSR